MAVALGIAAGLACGAPYAWIPIQLSLVALCALLGSPSNSPKSFASLLAAFALGFFSAAYIHLCGGVGQGLKALIALPVMALIAANVATAGAAGLLAHRISSLQPVRDTVVVPVLWMVQEWIFSCGPLAFPWARLGTSQAPSGPFAGLLPVGGTLLASGVMLAFASLTVMAWRQRRSGTHWPVAVLAGLGLCAASRAMDWTAPTSTLHADLVQSGINAEEKSLPGVEARLLRMYLDTARHGNSELLVTSQLAIPKVPGALPSGYLEAMAAALRDRRADAILGMYFHEPGRREFYNGLLSIGMSGSQRYLKSQLFPFGEFIPFSGQLLAHVQQMLPAPQQDTARPPSLSGELQVAGHRVAPAICFEAAFPESWREVAARSDVLLNVSSDSSIRTRQLARQFLQIDQARAIEFQKPLLRTSDIRGTYAIDDRGQLLAELPPDRFGALQATVMGRGGLTPYVPDGKRIARYRYNASGQRVSKMLGSTNEATYYLWQDGKLVAEIAGSGEHASQVSAQYLYLSDEGRAAPIAKIEAAFAAGNATGTQRLLYVHSDHRGQPFAMTDEGQHVVWRAKADAWGFVEAQQLAHQGAVMNLRLPGQYFDAETGLHDNWHRSYDARPESANHGRYLSPDPILHFTVHYSNGHCM